VDEVDSTNVVEDSLLLLHEVLLVLLAIVYCSQLLLLVLAPPTGELVLILISPISLISIGEEDEVVGACSVVRCSLPPLDPVLSK